MSARRFLSVASIIVLWLLILQPAAAMAFDTTGTIIGTVTDTEGAVLSGVTVTVRNLNTNLTREVMTDEAGVFQAALLPVGPYEIIVKAPDFNTGQNTVVLQINQVLRVYFQLTVAATVGEVIEVKGSQSNITVDNS